MEKLDSIRKTLEPYAWTLARVALGIVMIAYGLDKIEAWDQWVRIMGNKGVPMPGVMIYVAILGELGGGIGLVLGALTPLAAAGVAGSMVVATFTFHDLAHIIGKHNGIGTTLIFFVLSVLLMVKGGGPASVDAVLRKTLGGKMRVSPDDSSGSRRTNERESLRASAPSG